MKKKYKINKNKNKKNYNLFNFDLILLKSLKISLNPGLKFGSLCQHLLISFA